MPALEGMNASREPFFPAADQKKILHRPLWQGDWFDPHKAFLQKRLK
jgi:hypothetical protein